MYFVFLESYFEENQVLAILYEEGEIRDFVQEVPMVPMLPMVYMASMVPMVPQITKVT